MGIPCDFSGDFRRKPKNQGISNEKSLEKFDYLFEELLQGGTPTSFNWGEIIKRGSKPQLSIYKVIDGGSNSICSWKGREVAFLFAQLCDANLRKVHFTNFKEFPIQSLYSLIDKLLLIQKTFWALP